MKKFVVSIVSVILIFAIYLFLLDPIIFGKLINKSSPFADLRENIEDIFKSDTPGAGVKDVEFVYYTQDSNKTGVKSACFLTSYAMIITNAGRIKGTSKEYGPVDTYLANHYNYKTTDRSKWIIDAYHYDLAAAFNYKWSRVNGDSFKALSNNEKEDMVKEKLKDNPWGVIIGGSYSGGTHFIVARFDNNGKLVFDDPAKSKGPNIGSISDVHGINSWSKITSINMISPKLNDKGVWEKGEYEVWKASKGVTNTCALKGDCPAIF